LIIERRRSVKPTTTPVLLMATVLVLGGVSAFGQENAAGDEKDYARMP
jgi:hypothetical protein